MAITSKAEFIAAFDEVQEAVLLIIAGEVAGGRNYNRFAINADETQWSGMLLNESGVIESWMVSHGGSRIEAESVSSMGARISLDVVGFRGYDFGTDAVNSEKAFRAACAGIQWEFAKFSNRYLGLETVVQRHYGFSYKARHRTIGTRFVHQATGSIEVELQHFYTR